MVYNPLYDVDESQLNHADRLGLAWCRLNNWEWDEYVGTKPADFDLFPRYGSQYPVTKSTYLDPVCDKIVSELGMKQCLRCHWLFGLNRTEEEFERWFESPDRKQRWGSLVQAFATG